MKALNANDVGNYFQDEEGRVWRCVGFTQEPTVIMEALERNLAAERGPPPLPRVYGGVSGQMWGGWHRLVPQDD